MKHLKLLFLIIGLTILASCSKSDEEGPTSDANQATFSGVIGKLQTRVTGDSWNTGDEIGIYALKADQALSAAAIFDGKSNVKFTTTGDGTFTPSAAPINFPESGNLDFVAYYPFQNMAIDFVYNIDVSTQFSPAAIDLLYSNNAKGKNKTQPNVDLKFKHMLSKLVFDITLGENMSLSNGFNVSIKDVVVDGLFSLIDGKVALWQTRKKLSPVVNISSDNKSANVTAIVVPGQNLKDVTIEFTLDGKKYEWIPYSQVLVPSTKYSYALKLVVDDSGLPTVVPLKVGATIEEWVEGNTGGGEVVLTPTDDPIVGDEYKTINDIRTMYAAKGVEEWTIAEPLQLKAVIISDRVGGNSTSLKNGYIQDNSGNGLGFRSKSDHVFNLGEELIIDLQGAVISQYGGAVQLGFANEKAKVNATNVTITPKVMTVEEVLGGGYDATLVKVKDVQFKEYKDLTYFEGDFSTHSRTLENKQGKTIDVTTAKFAAFKDNILPKGKGNIVGIMSIFNGSWQLAIRNLGDISEMSNDESTRFSDEGGSDPEVPGDGDGTKEHPYTVAQAIAKQGNGTGVWVRAFIVGSSNDGPNWTPQFSKENPSESNVIIADNKNETDKSKAIPVQLAWDGDARAALSLLTKPGMYKAQVLLKGNLVKYFGVAGLKEVKEHEVITPGEGG